MTLNVKQNARNLIKQDISGKLFFIFACVIVLIKLLLASQQMVYIHPEAALIDDDLMFRFAVNIANGNWLGEYDYLTLSKYPLFSVWLAFLNICNIPYLVGGQILYLLACICGVYALAPLLRDNRAKLLLFTVLVFNPMQTAAAVQLRIYRENITNALSLFLFAGFIGLALRANYAPKKSILCLIIGGLGLAFSYLNREDGVWFLIFCIPASLITIYFILREKSKTITKFIKLSLQALPYLILSVGIIIISFVNLQFYGRFIISDYTSAEFNDACGALMRVSMHESFEQYEQVPVTSAAISEIADKIPQFKAVEQQLQSEFILNNFGSLETRQYSAGGFFWALRTAVYNSGYANTAQEAQQYYQTLADEINALCNSGELLGLDKEISSTITPVKAEYLPNIFIEAIVNFGRMLIYTESAPEFDTISVARPEDEIFYEEFLHIQANTSAIKNTALPYYSTLQRFAYLAFDIIKYVFIIFTVTGFLLGMFFQIKNTKKAMLGTFKNENIEFCIFWWIQTGLFLSVVLRCLIIAYMFITAFNPWVGRMPYLCCAQVALIIFSYNGLFFFTKRFARHKSTN